MNHEYRTTHANKWPDNLLDNLDNLPHDTENFPDDTENLPDNNVNSFDKTTDKLSINGRSNNIYRLGFVCQGHSGFAGTYSNVRKLIKYILSRDVFSKRFSLYLTEYKTTMQM